MNLRAMGATGRMVAEIGQGTWRMEADDWASCITALQRGLELGMTHVDTAEMYGGGEVEQGIVSELITGRREQVFLTSKLLPQNASRQGTIEACERSLRRLRTERLDLYLLHWPSTHPFSETLAGFEELKARGLIAAYGVSNFDRAELEAAVALAGPGKLACNQVLYHLQERMVEKEVLPFCVANGIALVAYSPHGGGKFPSPSSPGGRVLGEIAREVGATPRQLALSFLLRNPSVLVLPKHGSTQHAEENAGATFVKLSPPQLERIDAAFPLRPRPKLPTR